MRSRTKNNRRLCTCQVKDEQHRRSPLDLPALELKDEQIRLSFHAWVQGRTDEHHSRYSLEAEYTGKHGGIQRDTKTSNLRLTRLIWIGRRCCCAWASRDLRSKLRMMLVKIAFFAFHTFVVEDSQKSSQGPKCHNGNACVCKSNVGISIIKTGRII